MKPKIIHELFTFEKRLEIIENIPTMDKEHHTWDESLQRFAYSSDYLTKLGESLETTAREVFVSKELKLSYVLYVKYANNGSSLFKHTDTNACTYTIDYCLNQEYPWPLYVEDDPYAVFSNEALCYYGEKQIHWREKQDLPSENFVEMIFFHFVEPDHWFFTNIDVPPGHTSKQMRDGL
jgi:hypothetical protein